LLDWYDRHARALPWRVPPEDSRAGLRPDPYRVWLSEVMLQQTTVAAVKDYFHRFTTRWPTVADLAAAEDGEVMGEWAGLGYYARARNLLKCARAVVADHGGVFPDTRDALLTLPGIGPYTASAIAAIAFGRPETVVDGNVERVMARLHDIHTPLPAAKPELTEAAAALTPQARPGDYAQAVMDLGATICTPRSPACGICPWRDPCRARVAGTAADLPDTLSTDLITWRETPGAPVDVQDMLVRIPGVGAVVANCDLPLDRARGASHYRDRWLHVSPGLGHSKYTPFRIACRPEATLLELRG
jgi:A/G-specific adenine glycosylase